MARELTFTVTLRVSSKGEAGEISDLGLENAMRYALEYHLRALAHTGVFYHAKIDVEVA